MCLHNLSEESSERGLGRKGERVTNADFYVKHAVDLSENHFYQKRMMLMSCSVMNSTMRFFFSLDVKPLFVSDINVLNQKQFGHFTALKWVVKERKSKRNVYAAS
jgi:hypothetical protein